MRKLVICSRSDAQMSLAKLVSNFLQYDEQFADNTAPQMKSIAEIYSFNFTNIITINKSTARLQTMPVTKNKIIVKYKIIHQYTRVV